MIASSAERFRSFPLLAKMGNLASSLAHLATTAEIPSQRDYVPQMLNECKRLIEWTGPETAIDIAAELVDLQIRLARWGLRWPSADGPQCKELAQEARLSADQVLQWSGLLDEE